MNKTDLHKILNDALVIVKNNGAEDKMLVSQYEDLNKDIESFIAKIPVVGGFSAGKSAMLNSFLGDTVILPEGQSPETAISTELQYGVDEKVVRIKENGDKEICSFDDIRGKNAEGYSKYVYVLNRSQLRDLKELILVDMPGFDSGIEAHNRALMQCIGDAAAYVFVIDINKGTIGQSALNFLSEIRQYSNSVSFVLTKAEQKSQTDIENIRKEITNVLKNFWDKNFELMVMSIHEDGIQKKLVDLFNGFSVDNLLLQKHGSRVLFVLNQAVSRLKTQLTAVEFNPTDINLAIAQKENNKNKILNKIKQEEHHLRDDMRLNVPERIIKDVETELNNQLPILVNSAMQGNESFHSTLNNILRPILLQSTERRLEASFDDYMGVIENFTNEKSLDVAEVIYKIRNTSESVRTIAEAGKKFAKAQKYSKMYKLFSTGLAVMTNIVSPWLELVLIFLPDILGAINNILGQSHEDKLRDHIERIAIPQICDKLRPEIQKALLQLEEEQIEMVKAKFQTALDNEIQALEILKAERENNRIDVERKKESLSNGIIEINALISRVEDNLSEVTQ